MRVLPKNTYQAQHSIQQYTIESINNNERHVLIQDYKTA